MEAKPKKTQPKRHYEPKLTLYPMKFEDAVRMIAKAKPQPKKSKTVRGKPTIKP